MASSRIARALGGFLLGLLPAIVVAGCRDLGPATSTNPGASTHPDASTNPDAMTTDPAPTGPETLLISEVRSHGAGGDGWGDDFIELYNNGDEAVTVDASW